MAVNALSAADMALAGVRSIIPPDEVFDAMRSVGISLPEAIRETGKGGLAATTTGQKIAQGFSMSNQVHCRRPVRNLTLTGCFAAVLGGLILFLCLVCVSVTVTLNFRPLYYLDMKLLHISDSSGYSNDVIRKTLMC